MKKNKLHFLPTKFSKIFNHLRHLRDRTYKQISPNLILNARLKSTLKKEYDSKNINVIYDIGAHKGLWAKEMSSLMPQTKIILFEANPLHENDLKELGCEYCIGVLTRPGITECEFYSPESYAGSTGGSYYKEVTPIFDKIKGIKIKANTLEDVVESKQLPQPDLIKIDTQGSELDVIEGGVLLFKNAKWVIMELPTMEYNSGAPGISQYLTRMNELGFAPIDLCEIHKFGTLVIQLDLLFANKSLIDSDTLKCLRL